MFIGEAGLPLKIARYSFEQFDREIKGDLKKTERPERFFAAGTVCRQAKSLAYDIPRTRRHLQGRVN